MRVHAGFDIGTTNSKCLVLGEDGVILKVMKSPTPKTSFMGEEFFSIQGIECFVDSALSELASEFEVYSIGFSTVGESVVPVRNGKALSDVPLWNAYSVTSTDEERKVIEALAPASRIGTAQNPLFSVHKILWMKRNITECNDADFYLPLSSYLCYRKTGSAAWDYSQAARSGMFDVRTKEWIKELSAAFSIRLPEHILPMGSAMGEYDGTVYGLGGHDHIAGFYGIERILASEGKQVYYSSMGTSEVLAAIVPESSVKETSPSRKSYISPSFRPSSFIATRSFRSFGALLREVMAITGYDDYEKMNHDIEALERKSAACIFAQDGDFIGHDLLPGKLYISELDSNATGSELAQAAYLYLSAVSRIMRDDLERSYGLDPDYVFASGGAITGNRLFMRYLASALDHPVILLETEEISALGAALIGLSAYSDEELQRISRLSGRRQIMPDDSLTDLIDDAIRRYRAAKR